jgi:catechol 2,3-dioxygenase-like lactoylglutathione lyase family enzyme
LKFNRFEHLNLSCRNLEATKRFYQSVFPDWYVRAEGHNGDSRWMHLGSNQFYLALNDAPELQRIHEIYENIGINHVGFAIADGEEMKAWLDKNGIDYYTMTSPETKHRIYVTDPDGNEVELVEYQEDYPLK